jgi:hypothetical protein
MKFPRWFPRLLTDPAPGLHETSRQARIDTPPVARPGIRDVGHCEVCGRAMQARTRREEFRGRVDCDCGARNHVEYRDVRSKQGVQGRHISVTTGRRFESAMHRPDLRLEWRYGLCPSCTTAVRLQDAWVVAHEDAAGICETITYYCNVCHAHDDARRGRLMGHDGSQVVDSLRYQIPIGIR